MNSTTICDARPGVPPRLPACITSIHAIVSHTCSPCCAQASLRERELPLPIPLLSHVCCKASTHLHICLKLLLPKRFRVPPACPIQVASQAVLPEVHRGCRGAAVQQLCLHLFFVVLVTFKLVQNLAGQWGGGRRAGG